MIIIDNIDYFDTNMFEILINYSKEFIDGGLCSFVFVGEGGKMPMAIENKHIKVNFVCQNSGIHKY